MLWYCKFTWHPQTTAEALRRRILEQDEAGTHHPERVRGWYNLAGGGAGFMLIETDAPWELTDMLQPTWTSLMGRARCLRAGVIRGNDRMVPAESHGAAG